jgi:TolA-binding protein
LYPWAIYKIAWTQYNLKRYKTSLDWFKRVVSESKSIPGLSPAGREQIRGQALRDMVNVYAEIGDYRAAEAYFAKEGGEKYYAELLMQLARLLRERAQYARSIAVLRIYVARNPLKFESAEIQIEAIDTAALAENRQMLWREISFLLEQFGPDSAWAKANHDNERMREVKEKIEMVALSFAQREHALAQENKRGYEHAIQGYLLYLKTYPQSPRAEQIRFYLGEIYYQQQRYPQSIEVFLQIVNRKERGPYFNRSWEYLLSASYLPVQNDMRRLRQENVRLEKAKRPISNPIQGYLRVCNRYMVTFPNGDPKAKDPEKDFRACVVDTAEVYLKHAEFEKSMRFLDFIAKKYHGRTEGGKAVEMLLYLNQKNTDKLFEIAVEMIKYPPYRQGELGIRLQKIIESRSFEEALKLQKQGKHREAAMAFAMIHKKNPRGPDAAKAVYNAAINYRKARMFAQSMEFFLLVVNQYPQFEQAPDALIAAIQISEEALALDQAVAGVEQFLKRFPKHEKAPELRKQGCYFATVISRPQVAEKLCSQSRDKESFESLFEMYESLRDARNVSRLVGTARNFGLDQGEAANYAYRQALLVKRSANQAQYEQTLVALSKGYPATSSHASIRRIHAEALWYQMVPLWRNYMQLGFVANRPDGSDLQKSIETKQARMGQLEPSFLRITNYEVAEWTIAALYALGLGYYDLADKLNKAPLPQGLPEEVQKQLSQSFKELGQAPAEKGKAYLEKALEIAVATGAYTVYARDVKLELLKRSGVNVEQPDWIENADYVLTTSADLPALASFLNVLNEGR